MSMEDFVLYDEALEMMEIGFDEPCFGYWFKNPQKKYIPEIWQGSWENMTSQENIRTLYYGISAPTYAQCFRWFRKKYQFSHSVHRYWDDGQFLGFYRMIESFDGETIINTETFKEYEEAELDCLRELIKIVKTKLGK